MNIEQTRETCLAMHPNVEEGCPFESLGHPDIAFKIAGKIFAYLCMPDAPSCEHVGTSNLIVLKCDPGRALELREQYPGIIEPAWHWNKNTGIKYDTTNCPKPRSRNLLPNLSGSSSTNSPRKSKKNFLKQFKPRKSENFRKSWKHFIKPYTRQGPLGELPVLKNPFYKLGFGFGIAISVMLEFWQEAQFQSLIFFSRIGMSQPENHEKKSLYCRRLDEYVYGILYRHIPTACILY